MPITVSGGMSIAGGLSTLDAPALSLDFMSGTLDSRITFSRGTQGTIVDNTGSLTYAPNNLLRFSEQFDNAAWIKSAGPSGGVAPVVTSNYAAAPDGSITADRVVFTTSGTTSTNDFSVLVQIPTGSGPNIISSIWAKSTSGSNQTVLIRAGNTFQSITVTNSWQQFFVLQSSTPAFTFNIGLRGSVTGTVSSADILIWGAQLEAVTYQTTPGTYNSTTVKNQVGYSEDFTNAVWSTSNTSSISANVITAPNGTLTASKLIENTSSSTHYVLQSTPTYAVGTIITMSVYAKAGERNWLRLYTGSSGLWGTAYSAYFNLDSGNLGSTTSGASSSITSAGNGWYRCSLTLPPTTVSGNTAITFGTALNNLSPSYQGDGTSGLFIWGAQISDSASVDPYVNNPVAAPTPAAYYGPRFDYDPISLQLRGLLIEPQRTNLLTYSQDFTNAAWSTTNYIVTPNAIIAPDGTLTGTQITATSTPNVTTRAVSATSTTITFSIYAKLGTMPASGTSFLIRNGTTSTNLISISLSSTQNTNSFGTASVTLVSNGWYRVVVTATAGISVGDTVVLYYGAVAGKSDGQSWYVWGAQLEVSTFATSYIPTVASTVTRNADTALMAGTNFSPWYNQSQGTVYVNLVPTSAPAAGTIIRFLEISGASTDDRNPLLYSSSPLIYSQYRVAALGTSNQAQISGATNVYSANNNVSIAAAYSQDDFATAVNGSIIGTAISGTPLPTANKMTIGYAQSAPSEVFSGWMRGIQFYSTRLPNTQLQGISAL